MEDLESFYDDMETPGGDLYIPDRVVPVYRRRPLSQNTHYMLTAEEAEKLKSDPRVLAVAPVKLIEESVKLHSYTQTATFSRSPYTDAMDAGYKNWALLRCLEGAQRSGWGSDGTKDQTATITVGPTGKNVDVIIVDGICGTPNHPEFYSSAVGEVTYSVTNAGAGSYVINGSSNPSLTLIKGYTYYFNVAATGHPFWIKTAQVTGTGSAYTSGVTNNGTESGTVRFTVPMDAPATLYYICQYHGSMTGTLTISNPPSRYVQYDWYQLNSIATSLDDDAATLLAGSYSYAGSSSTNANHGAHVAGTVAGSTQGWARDANIYQISPLSEQGIGALIIWDYIRAFHRNKPINPATGRRNPTICNCSYGNSLTFPNSGLTLGSVVQANRRGTTTGPFGTSPYTPFTAAQLNSVGMYNTTTAGTVYTNVPYYIDANAADVTQALNDGIIIVGSSGNESFFVDRSTGSDYGNWFVASYGAATSFYLWYQHKGTVPAAVPGVICVGAVDSISTERKGYYSNTGPRVDVHAPGTWIVSSVANSSGEGWGSTATDSRDTSYYIGRSIGTSMASPQVCGVLACLLEIYPSMTPAQALTYIQTYGKNSQLSDTGGTSPTWTSDTQSLQGAPNRYLYMPKETPTAGPTWPKQNYWVRPTSGRTYPRHRIKRKG
jgi:hypothetical protein